MHRDHDPVESALEALRAERWDEDYFNHDLEEKLMTAYKPYTPAPRSARRHALFAVLAVLAIGGGTFAATGGVEKLKRWLVQVEVNGQVHEFETGEDEVSMFTVDTDEGPAEVQVEMSSSPEDGETQTVRIRTELASGGATEKHAVKRCKRLDLSVPAGDDATYTLGDATPAAQWQTDGTQNSVYLVPNAADEGEGFKVLLATTDADDNTTVSLLASPPVLLPANEDDLSVSFDADGMLTIAIADTDGREMLVKLAVSTTADPEALKPKCPLQFGTSDGDVQITIHAEEIDDE